MAADSLAPPPTGGGSSKYLIVLLLLLGGGLGVYLATRSDEPPPQAAEPPVVQNAQRSTALANDTLEIPDEIPEPEPEQPAEPEQQATATKKKPKPAGDPWSCEGDVDPKVLKTVLADAQTQIRSCYERRLRNDNTLQGDLTLQVRIGADGAVTATRFTRGTLNDKEVRECIQGLAKKWGFPSPAGGSCAVFERPYTFLPKN